MKVERDVRRTWRRAATVLAVVGVALLLFACAPPPAPTTAAVPAPTTAPAAVQQPTKAPVVEPKRGGTIVIRWYTGDPPDLDPYLNTSFRSQEFAGFFYSRLLKYDNGPGIDPNAFIPVPDLAEKFDISADGLTYTFHLRKNAKWHNKPPMNGRAVTADDVVWSWERFQKVGVQKAVFSIVKEVKATDANTVVFTLKEVFAPFENTVASPVFWIMPKEVVEADGDARKRIVGSGPFLFEKYEKGVQVVVKRNPDYYIPGGPYVDEAVLLIVPDSATAVAGLRAKQIDLLGVSQTELKSLKQTNPELVELSYGWNLIAFMYWRLEGKPFSDVRVRQAISYALNRDEAIKVIYEGNGVYNSFIPSGLASTFLDPRGPDFGPNAKYFKRDLNEVKRLLTEAGYSIPLKVPMISTLNAYGDVFNQSVELVIKQLKEAGIEVDFKPQDYSAYIATTYLGKFEPGTMVWGLETPVQEAHDYFYNMYHPKGARNHGGVNDPVLTEMIEKQAKTLDKAERKKLIYDIQRYLAEKQYYVIGAIGNNSIMTQPWVKGFHYQSDYGRAAEYVVKLWLDGKPQ